MKKVFYVCAIVILFASSFNIAYGIENGDNKKMSKELMIIEKGKSNFIMIDDKVDISNVINDNPNVTINKIQFPFCFYISGYDEISLLRVSVEEKGVYNIKIESNNSDGIRVEKELMILGIEKKNQFLGNETIKATFLNLTELNNQNKENNIGKTAFYYDGKVYDFYINSDEIFDYFKNKEMGEEIEMKIKKLPNKYEIEDITEITEINNDIKSLLDKLIDKKDNSGISTKGENVNYSVVYEEMVSDSKLKTWIKSKKRTGGVHLFTLDEDDYYILISGGRMPNGGYSVDLKSVKLHENILNIKFDVKSPPPGKMVTQEISYPNVIIKIQKTVKIEKVESNYQSTEKSEIM